MWLFVCPFETPNHPNDNCESQNSRISTYSNYVLHNHEQHFAFSYYNLMSVVLVT